MNFCGNCFRRNNFLAGLSFANFQEFHRNISPQLLVPKTFTLFLCSKSIYPKEVFLSGRAWKELKYSFFIYLALYLNQEEILVIAMKYELHLRFSDDKTAM